MKGYCVDVRGFSVDKKKLVVDAIDKLTGEISEIDIKDVYRAGKIVNIDPVLGFKFAQATFGFGGLTPSQLDYSISFNDLMLEAGFNYEERGVEDFKMIDWSEREVTENKLISNKTRPQITREQYDAVMAQSDKRTFTKALDDLLAIEKEQLLDESAIRIKQLEREVEYLDKVISSKSEELECALDIVNQLNKKNERLTKNAEEELGLWVKLDGLNSKHRQSLEKHKRISGVLSLLLISSVAAQLAVIFLGG